ncbi:MAG: protein kinase [Chloroflexi bacterium]|nr:protein kinase [Chloroflexota bacterium]
MLGRYQLQEKIGEGGMGTVYRAIDRLTNETVALKRVLLTPSNLDFHSKSTDADLGVALASEFQLLASLRHPHIISVLDYGFDENGQPFFTMPLIKNPRHITSVAARKGYNDRAELLIQALQALNYLHRRGVIHHDIKPGNVLVDAETGVVKVVDFGLALENQTRQAVMGTAAYMPPEAFEGAPSSQAGDMYAMGVLTYQMFTGHHPFPTNHLIDLVKAVMYDVPDLSPLELPQLQSLVGRLLLKNPEDRLLDTHEVIVQLCAALNMPLPAETVDVREGILQAAKFVGREAELKTLLDALEKCRGGHGGAWLIGGESGVGKSRLLDELRTHALVSGMLVLQGSGIAEGGPPFVVWRNIMRHVLLYVTVSDSEASILKPIVPDIDALIGRTVKALDIEPQRLARTMRDVIGRVDKPVLLILEDLHWTEESLSPIQYLINDIENKSLLMVGSYRNDERPDLPDELPSMPLITLECLSIGEIAQLSQSMLAQCSETVLPLIQNESGGNPLFIVEVVRALAEEAGSLNQIGQATLPPAIFAGGMDRIIQARLKRLPDTARPALELAAVYGREVNLELIIHLIPQLDMDTWLNICANAAIVEVRDNQWRFAHDRMRSTIVDKLAAEYKTALHERIATAIEVLYPDDPAYVMLLAHHWTRAENRDKAFDYIVAASEQMLEAHNLKDSVTLAEQAVELAGVAPSQIAQANHVLARAYERTGNFQDAARIARTVYDFYQSQANRKNLFDITITLASSLNFLGRFDESIQLLQDSLELAREIQGDVGVARVIEVLATNAIDKGKIDDGLAYAEAALAGFESALEMNGVSSILGAIGYAYEVRGDMASAMEHYERSLAIARENNHPMTICSRLIDLGNIASFRDELDAANAYFNDARRMARDMGDLWSETATIINMGIVAVKQGRYDAALAMLVEGRQKCEQMGDELLAIIAQAQYAWALVRANRPDDALSTLRELMPVVEAQDMEHIMLAMIGTLGEIAIVKGKVIEGIQLLDFVLEHPDADAHLKSFAQKIRDEHPAIPPTEASSDLPKDILTEWLKRL